MKSSLPPHRLATLGFVAGLALIDALEVCVPTGEGDRIALKWPNDLLADGRKFVGILLESESCADGTTAIVAGMGVNVAVAPIGTPYPSTCLADLGWKLSAQEVFSALSDAWVDRYAAWDQGNGMAAIRKDWLMHAAGVGGPVTVTVGTRQITGTFETLDSDGRLVVREPDGTRVPVSAGDVHFGAAATLPAAG